MCDDCQGTDPSPQYTNHLLECILDRLESDEYEQGPVKSVGGPNGAYSIHTPYNTECEFCVVGISTSVTGASPASVLISHHDPTTYIGALPPSGFSVGGVSQGAETNALDGYIIVVSATSAPVLNDHWQPLGRGANIFVSVSTPNNAVFVLIAFRRKLAKYIPQMERMYPKTHSSPQSRRALRQLPAASNFAAGFESQYPDLSGGGKEHIPYRHEQINEQDDTRNVGNVIRRVARYGR